MPEKFQHPALAASAVQKAVVSNAQINTPAEKPAEPSAAQKRAKHALAAIQALLELMPVPELDGPPYGKYVSFAKSLPPMIVICGLGQAFAFELSAANGGSNRKPSATKLGHTYLAQHLEKWLCHDWEHRPYRDQSDLLHAITNKDEKSYIAAQAEALLYLDWLKKFAVALLQDDEGGEL